MAMTANRVPLSPVSFLNRAADIYPGGVAVVRDDGQAIGYAELRRRARRLAGALRASGVERGDRVAVLAPNDLVLLEAHFGVPAAGAVLVALNTRLAAGEYAYIVNHARAKVLVVDATFAGQVAPVLAEFRTVGRLVVVGGRLEGALDYEVWLGAGAAEGRDHAALDGPDDEEAPITINYTSGTTGEPKGAVYTHRGAYLNALGQALELGLRPGSVYLWTLPMFHCNGWCGVWAVTAIGARHVCLREFHPRVALDLIAEHGVTHFCGAPVVLNAMAHDPSAAGRTFPQAVTVATGGAPPPPAVIARMSALGIDVVHLYGLTETYGPSLMCEPQPAWSELEPAALAERISRQGVRTVNVEGVRVVDEHMTDVPADAATMGEIVVRSNTVMAGYLDAPEANERAFAGGWFHTGDLAVVHPDGYVEVRDRAKDIIISGGENISSIEVENVIASHPDVLEVAVVAAPDEHWGEVPVAWVTPKPGRDLGEAEIIAWVRDRLAHFKAPKVVRFALLPKTSTGKIRKTELRALVQSARTAEVAGATDETAGQ